jgi:hypothetical protein
MTIRSSLGVTRSTDLVGAVARAAATARQALGEQTPRAALVVTAGAADARRVNEALRQACGEVPMVGGSVEAILSDGGVMDSGAAVVCFTGDALAPALVSAGPARCLVAAADRAGRLALAGAAHRRHYPRGLAVAFARPDVPDTPPEFMARWRELVGPKLRTIFTQVSGGTLYGSASNDPGCVAVLCLEGSYQTGLGAAQGFAVGDSIPDVATLVHGSVDAAMTAVKWLEGQPVRLALVVESAGRYRGLGAAGAAEWHDVRERIGADVDCLGWLTHAECAAGRGIVPDGSTGTMIVAALGDLVPAPPRAA